MRTSKREITDIETKIIPQTKKKACFHPSITHLQIESEKITAFLTDKREISIPTDWLTDKKPFTLAQLKHYEIWESREIYWPELKEVIGVETFTDGLGFCCDYH